VVAVEVKDITEVVAVLVYNISGVMWWWCRKMKR
jgi:hypothetical protein